MELYRSESKYGWCLKLCLLLFIVFLLVVAVILFSIGQPTYGAIVLACLLVYLCLYWCWFPKRLAVHEDAIRVQACCGIAVPLESVRSVDMNQDDFDERCHCICNLATVCCGPKVFIRRDKGANYVISPKEPEQFVEAAQAQLSVVRDEDGEMDDQEPGAADDDDVALDDTGGTGGTGATDSAAH